MVFTRQEAITLRDAVLQERKRVRNPKLDAILSESLSIEEVEKKFKESITKYPAHDFHSVEVLYKVVNDYNDPECTLLRKDVHEEIKLKYKDAFPDAILSNPVHPDCQFIRYSLSLTLP